MATKFFLRDSATGNTSVSTGKKSAVLVNSTADPTTAVQNYWLAHSLGNAGANQNHTSLASTSAQKTWKGRWTSNPLAAQTIAAQTWTFNFAASIQNAAANAFLALSVYVWRPSTNSLVGFIYDSVSPLGTVWPTSLTTRQITFSGSAVTAQVNDVLAIEVWDVATQTMATAYTVSFYTDGRMEVVSGGATLSDPISVLLPANDIALNIPTAGSLQDNFESGLNSSVWNTFTDSGTSFSTTVSGGQVNITTALTTTHYGGLVTKGLYSLLNGQSFFVKLVQPCTTQTGGDCGLAFLEPRNGYTLQRLRLGVSGTLLKADIKHNQLGTTTAFTTTYDPAQHAWLRIRCGSALNGAGYHTIYFDTAPTSASNPPSSGQWVQQGFLDLNSTTEYYVDLDAGTLALYGDITTGTPISSAWGTAIFDGFNGRTTAPGTLDGQAIAVGRGTLTVNKDKELTGRSVSVQKGVVYAGQDANSFKDSFDTLDTAKWDVTSSSSAIELVISSGTLRFEPRASGSQLGKIVTHNTYKFNDVNCFVKITSPVGGTIDLAFGNAEFTLVPASSFLECYWAESFDGKVILDTTYDPSTPIWLRSRNIGGVQYWDKAQGTTNDPPLETDWVNIVVHNTPSSIGIAENGGHKFNVSFHTTATTDGVLVVDGYNTATTAAITDPVDDFDRANGGLGANWASDTTDSAWTISGNAAVGTIGSTFTSRFVGVTVPPDQFSEMTLGDVETTAGYGSGPAILMNSDGSMIFVRGNSIKTQAFIRYSGYTLAQVGSDGPAVATDDVLYIAIVGEILTVRKNGALICGSPIDLTGL